MSPLEDDIRDALHAEANRLHEVRPLRLEPSPCRLRTLLASGRARRLRPWIAPVTAAALVIALAIVLAIVRAIQNEPVPPVVPTPPAPSAFPRYYVGLTPLIYPYRNAAHLVVGDSVTGKTLATFTAPAGTSFESAVPASAADDRTFVVADITIPARNSSFAPGLDAWYMLRLSPGSANPATMTRLAIRPSAPDLPVSEAVLSADGRYLAVAYGDGPNRRGGIQVYSVVTGHLVHAWTMMSAGTTAWLYPGDLSWVNGDSTVAFSIVVGAREQVRTVSVAGPGFELMTVSHVVWSQDIPTVVSTVPESGTETWCDQPTLTADGRTVTCSALYYSRGAWVATEWLAYPVSAPARPRVIALIPGSTKPPKGMSVSDYGSAAVYVTASAVIGYYSYDYSGSLASSTRPLVLHEFIARGGTIRPLGTGTGPLLEMGLLW